MVTNKALNQDDMPQSDFCSATVGPHPKISRFDYIHLVSHWPRYHLVGFYRNSGLAHLLISSIDDEICRFLPTDHTS